LEIVFKPRYGYFRSSKSVQFELSESTVDSDGWNITMYNQTVDSLDIVITRAPARCDSGGHYTLQFNSTNNYTILTHTEYIEIKSKFIMSFLRTLKA
jgi:predicted ABC-type ATPase